MGLGDFFRKAVGQEGRKRNDERDNNNYDGDEYTKLSYSRRSKRRHDDDDDDDDNDEYSHRSERRHDDDDEDDEDGD
jgi:hypothetical protein